MKRNQTPFRILKIFAQCLILIIVFLIPVKSDAQQKQNQYELNQSLWLAFQNNDSTEMRSLVDRGADINYEDPDGFNLLFWAQEYYADQSMIHLMKSLGAVDRNELVADFMMACESGNTDSVKLLLSQGIDVNSFRVWVDPIEEDAGCDCFETGISAAIRSGNIDLVRYMLEKGADINFDQNGVQPLFIALENRFYDIADLLLDHGADMGMKFVLDYGYYSDVSFDTTHLNYLIDRNFPYDQEWDFGLVSALLDDDTIAMRKLYPLVSTYELDAALCLTNDLAISKSLIAEGASVNGYYEDNSGCGGCSYATTPLNAAIMSQNMELISYLIEEGARVDVDSQIETGEAWDCWIVSPLTEAAYGGNIEIAQLLLDLGADVNYIYVNEYQAIVASPLIYAIQANNVEMVRLMMANGATITVDEWSALDAVESTTSSEIVDLLSRSEL